MIESVTKGFETTLVVSLPTSRGHYIKDKIFALIAFLITSFTVLFYFFHGFVLLLSSAISEV